MKQEKRLPVRWNLLKITISSILSALLLTASYFFPSYCALFASIFLIPLFLRVTHDQLSLVKWAFNGFLWGLCFFSLHWIFIIPALQVYASLIERISIYSGLVIYASLGSALWFLCGAIGSGCLGFTISWSMSTWLYFLVLEQYALVPFGFPGGYPFANPIKLCPNILLRYIGSSALLMIVISLQMLLAFTIKDHKGYKYLVLYAIVLWYFWEKHPSCSTHHIPPNTFHSYLDCAQSITTMLLDRIPQKEGADLIIMPEGVFPYLLNHYPEIIDMWTDNALHERGHLLIGAYCKEKDQVYNCVYHIYQRRIMQIYRKKSLMPFTETFFTSGTSITPNKNSFTLPNVPKSTLAICSDFFLNPYHYKDATTLILLVNDTWFISYMKQILFLYAYTFAYEHEIELVYTSYSCYTDTRYERA